MPKYTEEEHRSLNNEAKKRNPTPDEAKELYQSEKGQGQDKSENLRQRRALEEEARELGIKLPEEKP